MTSPPKMLLPWLVYQQSLTKKLKIAAGDARMDVLSQREETSDAWDLYKLKLKHTPVVHREILMWAFDSPCWYARTIIPSSTQQAHAALFDRLKAEPLGQLIFNGTAIKRASLIHYAISSQSMEYQWLNESMHQGESRLWVRLSEFTVKPHHPFFLVEILLPGLLRYLP